VASAKTVSKKPRWLSQRRRHLCRRESQREKSQSKCRQTSTEKEQERKRDEQKGQKKDSGNTRREKLQAKRKDRV
jgi:hypothetical protein